MTAPAVRILVVDDDHLNRTLLSCALEEMGSEVILAEDGLQAVGILERETFDAVLLDIVMPNMDGYQVLESIRANVRVRHVPVIMISAEDDMKNIMRCIEMGATDYLPKPFEPGLLRMRVKNVLQSSPSVCVVRERVAAMLVVDDDALNRMILKANLEEKGYEVETAEDGKQALAILKSRSFDIVFLDLVMPGISGFEVLSQMKADNRLRDIPVIVVSGEKDTDSIVRCVEAGATDHITKPFEPLLLHARVNASLTQKRLRDQELAYFDLLRVERKKSEQLLLNILPKSIADRLKNGEAVIADSFEHVTVLFADIVGFTGLTMRSGPREIVRLLNRIFSAFDHITETHGVEKIKTIGDAYLAVSGIPHPRQDHAEAAALMALDMLQAVRDLNAAEGLSVGIRIGMHSGPVVAGVIGAKKFTYDLWGDTVNVASRMESHGVIGGIHVSQSTFELLHARFGFQERGTMAIKGKGEMATYLLQ